MSDTSTTDLIARLRREAEGLLPAWRHKRRLINDAAARIEALEQQVKEMEAFIKAHSGLIAAHQPKRKPDNG
jgi:hypothetical protein